MRYRTYLKEHITAAAVFAWLLFSIELFLLTFQNSLFLMIYVLIFMLGGFWLITYNEYKRVKKYVSFAEEMLKLLEEKYLISEMMLPARSQEERAWNEILHELGKSMKENVNKYQHENKEYKEYIELWIHEVKLPIAAAKLMLQNQESKIPTEVREQLNTQIERIEGYTEQALFYARSNHVEKDYFIKEVSLQNLVNEVISQNRRELISRETQINLHDLDMVVYSDSKWLTFILNQIISNSIKYAGEDFSLEIYGIKGEQSSALCVVDNGEGIKKEEVGQVFEKGFTGSNGRSGKKSTGLGLYLCKKLCDRLGHKITLESVEGRGCKVALVFPISTYTNEVK